MTAPRIPPQSPASLRSRRPNWPRVAVVLAVLAVGSIAAVWYFSRSVPLPEGVTTEEYAEAERQFRRMFGRRPDHVDVLAVLGERAVRDERLQTAVACLREMPTGHPRYGPAARLQEGQVLTLLKRADEAERSFREFLACPADHPAVTRERLVEAVGGGWVAHILSTVVVTPPLQVAQGRILARSFSTSNWCSRDRVLSPTI